MVKVSSDGCAVANEIQKEMVVSFDAGPKSERNFVLLRRGVLP